MRYSATVNHAVETYKAMGELTRMRILKLLRHAAGELCVCELVDVLQKPQYTVSKALSVLKRAGLVNERREGKLMMYTPVRSPFNDKLFASLDHVPDETSQYETDRLRLIQRFALRQNGKCVITYR